MPTKLEVLRGDAAEAVATEAGFGPRRRSSEAQVLEAARLMSRVFKGDRRAGVEFAEALSTSDFANAAFDVLDREVQARYDDLPVIWTDFAKRTTVRDFRAKRIVDLMGGRAALDRVPELDEYPARSVSKSLYSLTVAKYGGRFAISWEAIVNDDLGELRDLPGNLAAGARDTESRLSTMLLTDGDGPNTDLFSATAIPAGSGMAAQSTLIAGNPALTTESLSAALTQVSSRRDPEGRPIVVQAYVLVVPPALEVTALNIVNATEIRTTVGGQETIVGNWLSGRVQVVVNPWLPVLDVNANAATSWYLLPAPNASRTALYLGFLQGHETPELRVKADTGMRVGGGNIPAEDGSFDIDDVQYRVRHVLGGTTGDPIAVAYSNGSGV